MVPTALYGAGRRQETGGSERAQATGLRRLRMELTEALISGARDEVIEISFTGDEDEWSEIAAVPQRVGFGLGH